MRVGLLHFEQNISIIIIFTYIAYIIYRIYTYLFLKCTQFLKINAGNSFSEGIHRNFGEYSFFGVNTAFKQPGFELFTTCILLLLLLLLLLLKKVGSARLRESDIQIIQHIRPKTLAQEYQPKDWKKRKGRILEDYNRDRAAYANKKALALLLKPASPTLSNTGFSRSLQPMCAQSTASHPHWHIQSRKSTIKRVHRITPDLTTDRRWVRLHSNIPPVRNRAPLTARSSCSRCVSAAAHHTAEQYYKTGMAKPETITETIACILCMHQLGACRFFTHPTALMHLKMES